MLIDGKKTKATDDDSLFWGANQGDDMEPSELGLRDPASVSNDLRDLRRLLTVKATSGKASDYLVVGDPEKSSTWHLPVKRNGTPDHRLMGAAWAALHGGYRGNKYEGPDKAKAISKLAALYASEELDTP